MWIISQSYFSKDSWRENGEFQPPPSQKSDPTSSVPPKTAQWNQKSTLNKPLVALPPYPLYPTLKKQQLRKTGDNIPKTLHPTAAHVLARKVISQPCIHLSISQTAETSKKQFGYTRQPRKASSWEGEKKKKKCPWGRARPLPVMSCNQNRRSVARSPTPPPTPDWSSGREGMAAGEELP